MIPGPLTAWTSVQWHSTIFGGLTLTWIRDMSTKFRRPCPPEWRFFLYRKGFSAKETQRKASKTYILFLVPEWLAFWIGLEGISIHFACLQAGSVLYEDSVTLGVLLEAQGWPLSTNLFQTYLIMIENPSLELISSAQTKCGFCLLYNGTNHTYKFISVTSVWIELIGPFLRIGLDEEEKAKTL